MNLWIVTIGSSDVQLDSDHASRGKDRTEKERSDKVWDYWCTDEVKAEYSFPPSSGPKTPFPSKEESYQVAPRILGTVYQTRPTSAQQEIWSYLTFPLLDNFVQVLRDNSTEYPAPEAIVVLLTDQSTIFPDSRQRQRLKCPYWQDTWELKAILQQYFQDRFPGVPCEWIRLYPKSMKQSLDNWNEVLDLVRDQFRDLTIRGKKIAIAPGENVYVSHQAGTPAISSAIQFVSLASFGSQVKFVVSNEQNQDLTDVVKSSSYLRGIQKEKAKKLLDRYDYAGLKELVIDYLSSEDLILLEAAIQWNFAEFEAFRKHLESHPECVKAAQDRDRPENCWWWTAYEAAYLGVVRLEQDNVVETMFHTFRALEGGISNWAAFFYPDDIEKRNGKAIAVLRSPSKLPQYLFNELKQLQAEGKAPELELYGERLFKLHRESIPALQTNADMQTLWKSAKSMRNQQFHQLRGLDQTTLFRAWGMNSRQSWENRILNCLNLIADQNHFKLLKQASLMAQVHQKLVNAIADL